MGIFDFWRKRASLPSKPQAATQSLGGGFLITNPAELDAYLRGAGVSASGIAVGGDQAMRVGTAYACMRIIAGAVATMTLQLKRRVDERTREAATDHPLHAVLTRRPNRWMTPSAFRRMAQMHLLLRGNAYALKIYDGMGRVIGLLPLHPDRVSTKQEDDLSVVHTYRRRAGETIRLPQRDVFHLVGLTLDGVNGVSVIRYARDAIGFAAALSTHGSAFFNNGTQLGSTLKHPGTISDEARDRMKADLEQYRGPDNAGKTLILEEGLDFAKVGMSADDAQFVESIRASRTDIAMFFGVPPHMIGDTDKTTSWGTGIEQQSIGFVAYTLEDWLTGWEQTINRDLIGEREPDLFARFNRASLVRGDIKTRYAAYKIGRDGGWLSANDIRGSEDMNPIEGGDEYMVPLNMATTDDRSGDDPDEPAQAA